MRRSESDPARGIRAEGPENSATSFQPSIRAEFSHWLHQTAFSRVIVEALFASRRIVGNDQGPWSVGLMADLESSA
jgi:hypothetical protein